MTKRRALSLYAAVILGLASSFLNGCAVVAVGAIVGAVAYVEGELVAHVTADIYKTVDATLEAATALDLRPIRQSGDETKAIMIAEDSGGNKVTIKLRPAGPEVTEVRIRYGNIGDKRESSRVLNAIERALQ